METIASRNVNVKKLFKLLTSLYEKQTFSVADMLYQR